MYVRLVSQKQSSIDLGELGHRLSHSAWSHIAFDSPSVLLEKHASLGNITFFSKFIQDPVLQLLKLLQQVLRPRRAFLLRIRQELKPILAFLQIIPSLSSQKPWNDGHQTFAHTVHRVYHSKCLIIHVFIDSRRR